MYATLDVRKAEATVQDDRVKILADIEGSITGGLEAFNRTLKVLFLLDPLDAQADAKAMLSGLLAAGGEIVIGRVF